MESSQIRSMTVLDIVSQNESTVEIFDSFNDQAGECICCNALFETVDDVIAKYGLDQDALLSQLAKQMK